MLKTGKRINSHRKFSEEFKRKLVDDFEKGVMSVPQLEREYGICNALIYRWIYKYSTYTTAEGLHKESNSYVLYAIPAAKELLSVLSSVIADAEQLTGVRLTIPIDVF